ncbi:MAG: glycosyltransferase family 39 protein [Chloroflexi bacterium]|nr:glycosyltransferase family 39 protein [Chloroflexota bacterium]
MNNSANQLHGPSRWGWAFLLLIAVTAVFFRFYQLGQYPPGLYHDEAYNGLDALTVLDGRYPLFFPANNGREPAYIYLTAAAIALVGRTVTAVRLGAAVVGSLATLAVYLLGREWFGQRVGLLSAWLWAVTVWSVHLGRVGLRVSLLAPLLALAFWLGTLAYRRQQAWLWLAAGLVYGSAFYTYLAVRFTPLVLLALCLYLLWQRRGARLWPGMGWFGLGTAVALLPLGLLFWQDPALILGRSGQVSILNPAINGGDLWGALARQTDRALGMFIWRGDDILRHNPAGRPVFDWLMAGPFLLGLAWCVYHWRRPAAAAALLWLLIMSGPTILAEDTPHFLRAAGVLPAALLLPALGLDWLWNWARLPQLARRGVVAVLLAGSLWLSVRDYVNYSRQPDVAYLFETAVTDLAAAINAEPIGTAVFLDDERYWQKYPTLPFLVEEARVLLYRPAEGLPPLPETAVIYAWPYDNLDAVRRAIQPPALVMAEWGSLARGDMEPEAYPLVARYAIQPAPDWPVQATFGAGLATLHQVAVETLPTGELQVDVVWQAGTAVPGNLAVFVHVVGPDGLIGQSDGPPGAGLWPADWWTAGLLLHDRRVIPLDNAAQPTAIHIGWYDTDTGARLPVQNAAGQPVGDVWVWPLADHG